MTRTIAAAAGLALAVVCATASPATAQAPLAPWNARPPVHSWTSYYRPPGVYPYGLAPRAAYGYSYPYSMRPYYGGGGYYLPDRSPWGAGYHRHYGYWPARRETKNFKPWLRRD